MLSPKQIIPDEKFKYIVNTREHNQLFDEQLVPRWNWQELSKFGIAIYGLYSKSKIKTSKRFLVWFPSLNRIDKILKKVINVSKYREPVHSPAIFMNPCSVHLMLMPSREVGNGHSIQDHNMSSMWIKTYWCATFLSPILINIYF